MKRTFFFFTQNMSSMLWRTSESALPHVLHILFLKKKHAVCLLSLSVNSPGMRKMSSSAYFAQSAFAKTPVLLIEPLRCQCLSQVQTNKHRQAGNHSSKFVFSLFQVFGSFTFTMYNRPSRKSREPKPGVFAGGKIRLFFWSSLEFFGWLSSKAKNMSRRTESS